MIDILENILKTNIVGFNLESYCILKIADKYNIFDYKDKIENLLAKVEILKKQGFLTEDVIPELTNKSTKLINEVEKIVDTKYDFEKLHKKLQDKLLSLKGKKQIEGFGGVYFIPTERELKEFLIRFWSKYPKYKDLDKISKILEKHIETCSRKNSFAPAIKYFIYKQNTGSQLANAFENYDENKIETENIFDGVNI